jgi:Zn-dependent protease with chaperone function
MRIRLYTTLLAALLITCCSSLFAQSENNKILPLTKEQKAIQDKNELAEAVKFLNEADLLKLKVYRLADTKKSDVEPQIAGDVISKGNEAQRLEKIAARVLGYLKLTDLCSVILYKSDSPAIFTYKLRSISLSTGIFSILTDDEAAALIAHETGHLFFGKELALARTTDDSKIARIVELKCDAVSLITLKNLKIDPASLVTGLKKLIEAREKLGLQTITDQSPSMENRINLTGIFLKRK